MSKRRLIYQVYVGSRSRLYDFCVCSVKDYCAAHGFEHLAQHEPILRIRPDPETNGRSEHASGRLGYLPIFEKENALAQLDHYDQVAVIDADVAIRPGSPSVFDQLDSDDDFGAVVERKMPLTDKYRQKIRSYSRGQYDRLRDVGWNWNEDGAEFMNMGVMVMNQSLRRFVDNQTPREFLARPEFKRFVDGVGDWKWSTDQTLLNYWLRKSGAGVQHLPWEWNALYGAIPLERAREAHFVHFFLRDHLPEKGENIDKLMREIA